MPRRAPDGGVPAPAVSAARLDGRWERVEATTETLFGVEGADVRGHTVVFEDTELRRAVRAVTEDAVDQSWRFLFATRLGFRPPLAPGIGPAMVLPTVRSEAVGRFAEDLQARGVTDVGRGRRERLRTEDRTRVTLRQLTGTVSLGEAVVPVEGWVGAWTAGDIHVAGGAYPRTGLRDVLEHESADLEAVEDSDGLLDGRPEDYRSALFEFVRSVG